MKLIPWNISGISHRMTAEKRHQIHARVAELSRPTGSFYMMVCLSTIIAAYGLLSNSTAVVIGAMLVAPLMGPIFGIALGLSMGDSRLLREATSSELLGVLLSVGLAALIGTATLQPDFGPEIIARTKPTIYDVLIALASGLAGAYAMADERISPALPGVAIATALVPPLATCGICLSAGFWDGARGAILLFFVNLLAIEFAAGVIFTLFGLVEYDNPHGVTLRSFFKKFGITMVVIILVGAFMTQTLVNIISERRLAEKIRTTLNNEVISVSGARLSEMRYEKLGGRLEVMAVIMTPREFEPAQVAAIESVLRQQVDPDMRLIVRSLISKDADRSGTVYISEEDRLNRARVSERNQFLSVVSALLTEQFRPIPGATMVDMFVNDETANSPLTINAVVRTPTPINPSQVADMEKTVSQLLDKDIHLVVRSVITRDAEAQGYIYEEKEETEILTGEALEFHQKLDSALREQILRRASSGSELVEFRYAERGENLMVLAVVHTPYTIRPTQVSQIESVLKEQVDPRIQLVVRSVLGADTSSDEYLPSFDESVFNPDY